MTASEKLTTTAPAATKTIGSAATTTNAAHGRPAAAASTRLKLPTDRETASARRKRARAITAQQRQDPCAQRTAKPSACHVPATTTSAQATTRASHGRHRARAALTKQMRQATSVIASARKTYARAQTESRLKVHGAPQMEMRNACLAMSGTG